jgi:hypothetical protein
MLLNVITLGYKKVSEAKYYCDSKKVKLPSLSFYMLLEPLPMGNNHTDKG